jgi:site-specific DNA-methyltransferase (adenine-specific)
VSQSIIIGDCLECLPDIAADSVDVIISSPPYNLGIAYGSYEDRKPREQYLLWLREVAIALRRVMKPDASFFLNVGGTNIDPWLSMDVAAVFRDYFVLQNHIIWVKSINIGDDTVGHFKPINSPRFLNYNHEAIFQFSKTGKVPIDRLAIGVAFADKSNIKRRHHAQDKRCAGNIWVIPYETVQSKAQKFDHPACVDQETECLTLHGWKRYDQLYKGELIAQFDLSTERLSWGPLEDIHIHTVENSPMINIESMYCDMMLTPNHRVVSYTRHQNLQIVNAGTMRVSNVRIPLSGKWSNLNITPVDQPFNRDWAELLGWYIAEGHITRWNWVVEIYQSDTANPAKVDRIRMLLDRVGAIYTEAKGQRLYHEQSNVLVAFQLRGFAALYLRQLAPEKKLNFDVLTWRTSFLWAMFRGLICGDGHIRKTDGRMSFYQKDKNTLDIVQAIAFRLNMSTHLSEIDQSLYFDVRKCVGLRGTKGAGIKKYETILYSGIVWCPQTEKTTWVARRNNRVFITGNSFPVELALRCIKLHGVPNAVVLDPFAGTGTTMVAAARLGCSGIGIEMDAQYAATAVTRLEAQQIV